MPGRRTFSSHFPLIVMPQRCSVRHGIGIGDQDGCQARVFCNPTAIKRLLLRILNQQIKHCLPCVVFIPKHIDQVLEGSISNDPPVVDANIHKIVNQDGHLFGVISVTRIILIVVLLLLLLVHHR